MTTVTASARLNKHAALLGLGACCLTGAVLWFNGSYGLRVGGLAMAAAFIGFAIVKDAGVSYAWAARGQRGRLAAGLLGTIAFVISCLAAIGAASNGRQDATDPNAKAIQKYEAADRQRTAAAQRLAELGKLPSPTEAQTRVDAALAAIDRAILKRTANCTTLAPDGSGPRQQAVNREQCQPYAEAKAKIADAMEAASLRQKVEAAEQVLAQGRPQSADAQASTLATVLSMFTVLKIDGIQSWLNLMIGLGLEIGSPLAWSVVAAAIGQNRETKVMTEAQKVTVANRGLPDGNGGNRRKKPAFTKQAATADIIRLFRDSGSVPSQDTLASRWSVGKGTVSKWLSDFERDGLVTRETAGRCKTVVPFKQAV